MTTEKMTETIAALTRLASVRGVAAIGLETIREARGALLAIDPTCGEYADPNEGTLTELMELLENLELACAGGVAGLTLLVPTLIEEMVA